MRISIIEGDIERCIWEILKPYRKAIKTNRNKPTYSKHTNKISKVHFGYELWIVSDDW